MEKLIKIIKKIIIQLIIIIFLLKIIKKLLIAIKKNVNKFYNYYLISFFYFNKN